MKRMRQWGRGLLEWQLTDPKNGLWLSFFVPVFTMLCLFLVQGVYPFGDRTFLRSDMYSQYAPFFMEFCRKIRGGEDLWYTWNLGMGTNFWAIYVYYLAAPWNWLIFLCPEGLIIEFMTGLMILKMGLCGLTMTWYLGKRCGGRDFDSAIFGCIYGLSGYVAAYGWNLMWLDCLWLLPLILWGLTRLADGEDGLPYCLTLGLSILCNYYISMMICLFAAFWFLACRVRSRRVWLTFAGYSVLAAGLSGALLIPELLAVRIAGSGENPFPGKLEAYFGLGDLLLRHLAFVVPTGLAEWGTHLPNLYCGSLVFVLLPVFFLADGISRRRKLLCGGVLIFFWLSFSVNLLDFIWHGFHYPRGLPGRQSFLYIFLVLLFCRRGYQSLFVLPARRLAAVFGGAAVLVVSLMAWNQREEYPAVVFISELVLLGAYGGLVWLLRSGQWRERTVRLWFFLLTVGELFCYMNLWGGYTSDRTEYLEGNRETEALFGRLKSDSDFFRVQTGKQLTDNDGALMGVPDTSIFSSTAYADMQRFFLKLEGHSSPVAYGRYGDTPLENLLFAKRYRIGSEEAYGDWEPAFSDAESGLRVFRNPRALPLGFWVDETLETAWQEASGSAVQVQNRFLSGLGIEPPFQAAEFENGEDVIRYFYPDRDGYWQILMGTNAEELILETGGTERILPNVPSGALVDLGFLKTGERVTLTTEEKTFPLAAELYYFSEVEMGDLCERLSRYPLALTAFRNETLAGTVSCPGGGKLMTTIPFDPGWTVMVDGERREPEKLLGAFLGIPLSGGTHQISMEFRPAGLTAGLTVSAVSVLILLLVIGKKGKIKIRQKACRIFWP